MNEFLSLIEATPVYVRMAILLGVALLIATATVMILYPALMATAKRVKSFTLEAFARRTRSSVFWLFALLLTLFLWNGLLPSYDEQTPEFYVKPMRQIVRTLMYFFAGVFLIKITNVVADTIRYRYNIDDRNNLRERKILTQLQYIQRIAAIVIFIIILALILMQFDSMRSLGRTLITSAGVGGIIIGLAAQKSIANLLAGFQIAFTQPIRLDDALIVNGEYGWVEEITLTYVTMRLWDQRRQIVPLQFFIDGTFQNWTRSSSELTGTVLLHVDYTFPVAALREEIDRWLPQQDIWDERVNSVMVTDNTDRVMVIRVLVSAKDAGTTFELRCRTREHLIHWIQENYRHCLPQNRVAAGPVVAASVEEDE